MPKRTILTVTNTIDLKPEHRWLNYAQLPAPLPCPPALPFDRRRLADGIASLGKFLSTDDWARIIPVHMSQLEASAWLSLLHQAMQVVNDPVCPANDQLSVDVCYRPFSVLTTEQTVQSLCQFGLVLPPCIINPLLNLISLEQWVELLLRDDLRLWSEDLLHPFSRYHKDLVSQCIKSALVRGYARYRLPYASDEERQRLRELILPHVSPSRWPAPGSGAPEPIICWLAAALRMHQPIRLLVESWPNQSLPKHHFYGYAIGLNPSPDVFPDNSRLSLLDLIMAIGQPALIIQHFRRLGASLECADDVLAWLANTGLADLEPVERFLTMPNCDSSVVRVACRIHSPLIARSMLLLAYPPRSFTLARSWLNRHKATAIAGLLTTALGRDRLARLAGDWLRQQCEAGHAELVRQQIDQLPPQQAATLHRRILQRKRQTPSIHTSTSLPAWFRQAAASIPQRDINAVLRSLRGTELPPLTIDGAALGTAEMLALLAAAKISSPPAPHPLIAALRQHVGPALLDQFVRELAQTYIDAKARLNLNYLLPLIGQLGGEQTFMMIPKLSPRITGPGSSRRFKQFVRQLAVNGSDLAVQMLFYLKRRTFYPFLNQELEAALKQLAHARGVSLDQLDEQTTPTLGLNERGSRSFDYGPRRFEVIVGPNLTLILRDQAGRIRQTLPKPNRRDNSLLVCIAVSQWRCFRERFKETITSQTKFLETAMTNQTRWSRADFERWIVAHPLITHLAQLLVWQGHAADHRPLDRFRITAERGFADVHDRSCTLDHVASVSLANAVQLSREELHAWQTIFADHELIQPFAQLDQPQARLPSVEPGRKYFAELSGLCLDGSILHKLLRTRGWQPLCGAEAGFVRAFPDAGYAAILKLTESGPSLDYAPGKRVGLLHAWVIRSSQVGAGLLTSEPIEFNKIPLGLLAAVYADVDTIVAFAQTKANSRPAANPAGNGTLMNRCSSKSTPHLPSVTHDSTQNDLPCF